MSFSAAALVLALSLAAVAVQAMTVARSAPPRDSAWAAAFGGGALAVALMTLDGGRILRWRYSLGSGADRIELPGAALVLGLALLVSLAGTLSMAAHLLASTGPTSRARLLGQRLLVLGAGLGVLGVGVVAGQGRARSPQALAGDAFDLAVLVLAVGLLVLGLARLLAGPVATGARAERLFRRPARMLRLAAAAALLAAGVAGVEAWWTAGSYAAPPVGESSSAALLGLAATEPTRLGLTRAVLFVLGLLAALARAA